MPTFLEDAGTVRVKDLEADNIDLIQNIEDVRAVCKSEGYKNDDDYEYAFIVARDKARTGSSNGHLWEPLSRFTCLCL